MSPTEAAGRRFKRPLIPPTAMMCKFLAPVLSVSRKEKERGRKGSVYALATMKRKGACSRMFPPHVHMLSRQ
jgi:hypothetical protein